MSRAFVKEPDGDAVPDDQPERPRSSHPNYVTPAGLARLSDALADLRHRHRALKETGDDPATKLALAKVTRDLRHLEGRLDAAVVVDPAGQPAGSVRFGAVVEVEDEDGGRREFAIVGEDEAEAAEGRVSWISPLARALADARVGDLVIWPRPSGDVELEVVSIRYPPG